MPATYKYLQQKTYYFPYCLNDFLRQDEFKGNRVKFRDLSEKEFT